MQKIVYILGAGFSKPLGLPIMSNFIDMAKDIYSRNDKRYSYFSEIFTIIHNELAWVKTVYDADLNNIEEVLSILEMLHILDKIREKEVVEYKRFLSDVIEYFTPQFNIPSVLARIDRGDYLTDSSVLRSLADMKNTDGQVQSSNILFPVSFIRSYIYFVLGLFNAKLETTSIENVLRIACRLIENPYAEYSIVTLNYDLVLENIASFLSSFATGAKLQFSRSDADKSPKIVHLHGSVDKRNIIPPTWQKNIDESIEEDWQTAYEKLSSANHIRIIGYSLPITDAYIRYLFKASILKNNDLKSINVLCLDRWGTIKNRYDEFIKLPPEKYQFSDIDVTTYLESAANRVISGSLMDDAPKLFTNDKIYLLQNRVGKLSRTFTAAFCLLSNTGYTPPLRSAMMSQG